MNQEEHIQVVKQVFDTVAKDYDCPALRFFPLAADFIAQHHPLESDHKILDICTGTGYVAQALAQRVPRGSVSGIDISPGMLEQAATKNRNMGLSNIELYEMDAMHLQFDSASFHSLTCAFGVFFMLDMPAALRTWARVIKPGGSISFTGFAEGAFEPYTDMTIRLMEQNFAYEFPENALGWKRMSTPEQCREVVQQAGLELLEIKRGEAGYFMTDASDWWEILMNAGFRGHLMKLTAEQQGELKGLLAEELSGLATPEGILLDLPILLVQARKLD